MQALDRSAAVITPSTVADGVITARRVVTPDGIIAATVHVENGVITVIEPSDRTPDHEVLVPGFVDLQVNGHRNIDVATMTIADQGAMDAMLLAQGVTTWCPTLITMAFDRYQERLAFLRRWADTTNTDREPARPNIAGVHLEGPYLGLRPGAHVGVPDGPIDLDWLNELDTNVAIMTLGPERSNAVEAIEQLVGRGVRVAVGHTAASYEQTLAAVDAGASLFTHCFNACTPLHHREPGPIGAALSAEGLTITVIADLVHVHPAVLRAAWRAKGPDGVILVTDAAAWQTGRLGPGRISLVDGAPRLADGTLAGSSLTMDRALRHAVNDIGVPLEHAVWASSSNPAKALGCNDRGVIAVGMRADLVALDDDLGVSATYVAGRRAILAR